MNRFAAIFVAFNHNRLSAVAVYGVIRILDVTDGVHCSVYDTHDVSADNEREIIYMNHESWENEN